MKKKIVISGMGAVTPIGIGVENYWEALLRGNCGIVKVKRVPPETLPVPYAGEVKDYRPKDYLSSRLAADLDTFQQFAYIAAEEALKDCGMEPESERVGIVMGSALNGISLTGETQKAADEGGDKQIGPRLMSKVMGNMAAALFSINHGINGPSLSVSTACSSGGDAIVTACMLLESGAADAMIVMAGEAPVCALTSHSLFKAGAMSKTGSSRPFDKNRDGFVMGEGGGALVLETEEHALARGARIHAELLGFGNNNDAFHPVSPAPGGEGAVRCMRMALEKAGLTPWDIGYVNAHGTATIKGDEAENAAINTVFGDYPVPVSSTKGATGHMMGAGGVTEVIACVKAVQTGWLPPNINFEAPQENFDLNIVANKPVKSHIRAAMSNAFGFGGQNSSIIVGKYE
ncbi:MAG: beta-ketoacyl-[acyl-carrier-protein] synthase family protein [Clostridiales bacterium]|nr:beta-ketoacyl-[acyl-carrier-protein] synthase family protein [Clostridiales bacterium]